MALEEAAHSLLTQWVNFYVIVGSSAGALTGLQFVVIALIADAEGMTGMQEIRAFGTPTVVHFSAALLVSAILSAPWQTLSGAGATLGVCGAAGVVYATMVIRHARRQVGYSPDAVDWLWYAALPLITYVALLGAAILLVWYRTWPLFVIAGTTLLLLFVGIHNAWEAVTYVAVVEHGRGKKGK